jgi:hypothetical protein
LSYEQESGFNQIINRIAANFLAIHKLRIVTSSISNASGQQPATCSAESTLAKPTLAFDRHFKVLKVKDQACEYKHRLAPRESDVDGLGDFSGHCLAAFCIDMMEAVTTARGVFLLCFAETNSLSRLGRGSLAI